MSFDPETFLNQTIDAPMATKRELLPEQDFPGQITGLEPKQGTNAEGRDWAMLTVIWDIQDAKLKEELGREKITVRQDIFLEADSTGNFFTTEKGKNVALGKLREAVGQNTPGWSPRSLVGAQGLVKIGRRTNKDTGEQYDNVKSVSAYR